MDDRTQEHDLFSEDFEKKARALLDDPVFAPAPEAEPDASGQESIDDINALLLSVGLSPIEDDAELPAEPEPMPEKDLEKSRIFIPPMPDRELEKSRRFMPPTETAPSGSTLNASAGPAPDAPQRTDEDQTMVVKTGKQQTQLFTPQSYRRRQASAPEPVRETDDGQMMLDGYVEEAAPRRVNEAEVEAQLQQSRKNLVENFRVLSSEQEDNVILEKQGSGEGANSVFDSLEVRQGEPLFDAVEKADKKTFASLKKLGARAVQTVQQLAKSDRKAVQLLNARVTKETLTQTRARVKKQTIVLGVLFALSLLLNLFGAFYTSGGALEFLFGHGARLYTVLHLLLFAGGVLTVFRDLTDGVRALQEKRWSYHATVLVLDGCVLLHSLIVLAFGMDEATGFLSFSLCALFLSLVEYAGNLIRLQTLQGDLAVMMHAGQLQGLCLLEDEADAAALGRGITDKTNPQILISADVPIAPDYDRIAMEPAHEKLYFFGTAAALAVSFVFALVRAIMQKNAIVFFSAFMSCAFLCTPFMRGMISTLLKVKNDATLGKDGIVVAGTKDVALLGKADAVVADAADLFTCAVSRFKPVPGGRMQRADAAIYAAATLRGTRSLLADAFEDFLAQTGITAPEAEDLQYEDKLGYSCWIAGRRVLVGTREMLVQHSIAAPSAAEEAAYAGKDSVLYVAVEGIVAATFLVTYQVRPTLRRAVRSFNKSGLVLMLTCGDPSLNETIVAKKLALDVAAIKIADQKGAKTIETHRADRGERTTGLLCVKGRQGVLPLIRATLGLYEGERFAEIVHIASLVFCFLLLLLCVVLQITSFFLPPTIVFLHLLWSLAAYYVGTTRLTK